MARPGQSEAVRNHKAALATAQHYESQKRAAKSERDRWIIGQALDEARARLRLAEKDLEKEAI